MNSANHSELTPIDLALTKLAATLPVLTGQEAVALTAASGRILVASCTATVDVPPYANSAMDGYAVKAADVRSTPASLVISQRIAAGQVGTALGDQEAARIFTGAPLPEGADAVVMQENCSSDGTMVTVEQAVVSGENLRSAGDDIKAGTKLFEAGHRLQPQDIALLASLGMSEVNVRARVKVALMTTGDELVQPGTELAPGQIYNSNFYSLSALLQSMGAQVIDVGRVRDDLASTSAALLSAAESADCVISTGGVSVGEEDYVRAAVEAQGVLELWKLAIKPGKPLACGKVRGTQFFGLPGNPVSAFVTFLLVVKPALLAMSGVKVAPYASFPVAADFEQGLSGQRQEYLRVRLQRDQHGEQSLQAIRNQSSGAGSSLSHGDGLAMVPPYTAVAIGETLQYIPFSELLS